ncbi:aspartyl-phosphate phosphatase Spo0E family protein [Virgibacillus sp. Bac330]|uniref:aspartyl-phosphate phosphatase Spo0E family protein n=1 Tax=Virgibacillus sp. Bac330 TaxID=2419841 RepID=UPI0021105046|nr:aspartyl-phosphate phosphatase Spo0E family protein [Virgibacillus sp. Bac330]
MLATVGRPILGKTHSPSKKKTYLPRGRFWRNTCNQIAVTKKEQEQKKLKSKKDLCQKIKCLKIRMIKTSKEKGMNHPLTIQTSQKLDRLINEYMNLTKKIALPVKFAMLLTIYISYF